MTWLQGLDELDEVGAAALNIEEPAARQAALQSVISVRDYSCGTIWSGSLPLARSCPRSMSKTKVPVGVTLHRNVCEE